MKKFKKDDINDLENLENNMRSRRSKHSTTSTKKSDNKKTDSKKKDKKSRKKEISPFRRKLRKLFTFALMIFIIYSAISFGISINNWKNLSTEMMNVSNSVIIDINGKIIAGLGSERIQKKISSSEIPQNLKNAYVSIEDERFYTHSGVDIKRTGSAIASYIIHLGFSSFGGSTITQQLVKNLTGENETSISRKVKEWSKATQLEWFFSKDEILTTYLNIIYVGPNIYGVEMGSKYYFNKSASDLSLAECAFLAGINNTPNSYNPFSDTDKSEKINKRTKIVLAKMLELGYISETEYNSGISEVKSGLKFKKGDVLASGNGIYSYHTDALISQIISDIANEKKISSNFATNYLYTAGLKIYSTQDSIIQSEVEKEFEKNKYAIQSKKDENATSQAAMVIIDHKTGNVVGLVGGLGKKNKARPFNRATQALRQTGSAIKPIAVLAPSLDKKITTAASLYDDTLTTFADGYTPQDYSDNLGTITVRRAVESSQNIPFVKIMEQVSPKTAITYLENMGFSNLTENDVNLGLALGGLDKGVSPLEMASAYATIANDGVYIEPTFYTKITDSSGFTIFEPKQKSKKVFSKEVAFILKDLLTQPIKGEHGTATYCGISGIDTAAKTGTTNDNYDRWLCGFTPYYTATVWYGFDINEAIDYNGRNPSGLLWSNVMHNIHSALKKASFVKPDSVISSIICSSTGKIATNSCKDSYTEYFLKGTLPDICINHKDYSSPSTNSSTKPNEDVDKTKTTLEKERKKQE